MSRLPLPPLPPISSPRLRKHAFTHASVFRLAPEQLDQIENVDNDRLSFLGRAAVDLVLATLPTTQGDVTEELAACARTYEIVERLHMGWTGTPAASSSGSGSTVEHSMLVASTQDAAQLMEAYIGALTVESEQAGVDFTRALVGSMRGVPFIPTNAQPEPTASSSTNASGTQALSKIHDLAAKRGLRVSYSDHAQGPRHAQEWTSELELRDDKINRVWPSIARGSSGSKKGARADAAVRALEQWEEILRRL